MKSILVVGSLTKILMKNNTLSPKEADVALFVLYHPSSNPVDANSCSFAVHSNSRVKAGNR